MTIKTQFDTSIYGSIGKNQTTIGEIASTIKSIRGIVKDSRQSRKQEQTEAEDNYLNEVYARNFNNWDGRNQQEFYNRNQAAIAEVARDRSSLYFKALGFSSRLEDTLRKRQTGAPEWRRSLADEWNSQPQPYTPAPYNARPEKVQRWEI
jgi:hypothetical protein